MATSGIVRRHSYDRLRSMEYDQTESAVACDCGQEYINEESLKRHQQTNCKNRLMKCSFCSETFASSDLIRDHLLFCGNKTDECPRCRQLIRRSHFAYHYENKCAATSEIETPPSRIKTRSTQHIPTNLNMPFSRVDVPSNDYSQDYSDQRSLTDSPRGNGRVLLPIAKNNDWSVIIICEFCHNNCVLKDYKTHKDNCLRNPVNMGRKQPVITPSRSNHSQTGSNGIVHIPCEICQQPIDLPNWSNHTQNCREREKKRLVKRAETISKEPLSERLPCEYCQQLYLAEQLHGHERSCMKNPTNVKPSRKLPERSKPSNVILPTKQHNNQSDSVSLKARSDSDPRFAKYQRIDIDRTHQANRSRDYDKKENYVFRGRSYDIVPIESNEDLLSPLRADNTPRRLPTSDNLRNIYNNQDAGSSSNDYVSRKANHKDENNFHRDNKNYKLTMADEIRPKVKSQKKSWIKELFGCTSNTRAEN